MSLTVYFAEGHNSCRACGLTWHAVQLEPCPRCNEGSLHAQAVDLLEERDEARTIARQLLALVKKLRGDLDGTKGQLKRAEKRLGVDST